MVHTMNKGLKFIVDGQKLRKAQKNAYLLCFYVVNLSLCSKLFFLKWVCLKSIVDFIYFW